LKGWIKVRRGLDKSINKISIREKVDNKFDEIDVFNFYKLSTFATKLEYMK